MDRSAPYRLGVFINCPFDDAYRPIRDALIFGVYACHLRPRCALEASNFGQTRVDKIVNLIRDCLWGIHDLSQIGPNGSPHFNMPLELGLFLGAHRFGGPSSGRNPASCWCAIRTCSVRRAAMSMART